MEHPHNETLRNIEKQIDMIETLSQRLEVHRALLAGAVQDIGSIEDKQEKLDTARYVYWHLQQARASDVSIAMTGRKSGKQFLDLMGSVTVGLECDRCSKPLPIKSRTQLARELELAAERKPKWPEGFTHLCNDCEARVFEILRQNYDLDRKKAALRIRRLRSLAYEVYRRTSYWEKTEARILAVHRYLSSQRERLTCQLCDRWWALKLRHKSLDKIGEEDFEDLLLLCVHCQRTLTDSGVVVPMYPEDIESGDDPN